MHYYDKMWPVNFTYLLALLKLQVNGPLGFIEKKVTEIRKALCSWLVCFSDHQRMYI